MSEAEADLPIGVGALAARAGVSPQTLRTWEAQGLISSDRTAGGQRRYSDAQAERAIQIGALRRQRGWNPAAILTALGDASPPEPSASGQKNRMLRIARKRRGLSLRQASATIGVSPALLSSVERGQAPVSTELFSRIADAYGMPMNALIAHESSDEYLVRREERPVGRGNVTWEELARPGYLMAPSMVTVPAGEDSGGEYSRSGDTFVFALSGTLQFRVNGRDIVLNQEDSLLVPGSTPFAWVNDSEQEVRVLWVESISPASWTDPLVQQLSEEANAERAGS